MKKLFSGKFRGVPMALFAVVLLAVLVTGGVVAATGGYVLWKGTSEITVNEPITIYYGSSNTSCTNLLTSGTTLDYALSAGDCANRWFKFTSAAYNDLLIKAEVVISDESVVTVNFYDAYGASLDIDGVGLTINSGNDPIYVCQSICVDGAAVPLLLYDIATTFTRDSPTS